MENTNTHNTHQVDRSHGPRPSRPGSQGGIARGSRMRNGGGGGRNNRRRDDFRRSNGPTTLTPASRSTKADIIPPVGENIRIIPLGGVEEIGKNMTVVEIGDDIIVIDAGFQFKEEETPGIDYIIPNIRYLEERKHKIRALIVTHGHLDHIGGLPYIIDKIGYPPIYTRNLTAIMLRKRQAEFAHLKELDYRIIEKDNKITVGKLTVRFFAVTHTIPDSMGIIIDTPYGGIVTPGDFKLNHVNGIPTADEEKEYAIFDNEKTLFLMADSTNIENPGFSTPESIVHENLEQIIKDIKGRLIIGTFSSQFLRMIKIIEIAEKYNKKIVVEGRSMKMNIEIATLAGMFKVKPDTLISAQDIDNYPPDRVIILATGAQGEEFAALMRMANKTHKFLRLTKRDTVLLSSSIIPGNEKTVQKLKDNLARQGAKIIHYRTSDVYIHSTGHANRGEVEWLHRKIKPRFFMPMHGTHYMLRIHAELAQQVGLPEDHVVVPDNGSIVEIVDKGERIVLRKEKAPHALMTVDGFSVGDVQEVVMRDRQLLAQDGIFVIVASVNTATGKLKKSPDIIARGFVYLRESQELLHEARFLIKKVVETTTEGMHPIDFEFVKEKLTEEMSHFLLQKTAKRPIVIPVVLGV